MITTSGESSIPSVAPISAAHSGKDGVHPIRIRSLDHVQHVGLELFPSMYAETDYYPLCHNNGMAVRTTIDIPEPLHERLRHRAENSGASIRLLIIYAIEQTYPGPTKGRLVTGPLIRGSGRRGPHYPTDENPHDLVFS